MRRIVVLLVLAIIVLGSCSVKQKITGTWVDNEKDTWVFNANGVLTKGSWGNDQPKRYTIISGRKISITDDIYYYNVIYDIKMIDSKNMTLERFSTEGDRRVNNWWEVEYSLYKK
jgi:hypothetical protein